MSAVGGASAMERRKGFLLVPCKERSATRRGTSSYFEKPNKTLETGVR